jgi:hypothetical protein
MKTVTMNEVEISIEALEKLGFTRKESQGRWKPVSGDAYYAVDDTGRILKLIWNEYSNGYSPNGYDDRVHAMGNCYKTEAEAQQAVDKQLATVRALDRLRELERDWVASWSNGERDQYAPLSWYSTEEAWEQVRKELEADIRLMLS